MEHKVKIELKIMEFDISNEEISEIIGFTPDRYWKKGEKILEKSHVLHKENGVKILPRCNENEDFDLKFNSIIDIIKNNILGFEKLGQLYYIELSIVLKISKTSKNSLPWINIDSQNLLLLSKINANIDFDIYNY